MDQNYDATLFWQAPADTGSDFNAILISYTTNPALGFNVVAQISDYNQTSTVVSGNYAVAGSFILQQVYNGFGDTSEVLDTLHPIIVGITGEGKDVSIGWNPTGVPSSDSIYRLQKEVGGMFTNFKHLDFPHTAARDSILSCSEDVAFRVEVNGMGGCVSRSNEARQTITDDLPPEQQNLTEASVDTTSGAVLLSWESSKSLDTKGYIVWYFEDFVRFDTIFGKDSTIYRYNAFGIDALSQSETLSVAPFDSCFDAQSNWYNQAADSLRFQTLFVDSAGYDRCARKLWLQWNTPDSGYPVGVRNPTAFRIYRKILGEGSTLLATVAPEDSIFVDSTIQEGNKYHYAVMAVDEENGYSALSNKFVFNLAQKDRPDFFHIKSIRNDHGSGFNQVNLLVDTNSELHALSLIRSLREEGGFVELFRQSSDLDQDMILEDESGKADQSAFYYQVVAYDVCGDELGRSQIAKSIHISGEKNIQDLINTLEWNAYQGFDTVGTEVGNYDLFRLTQGGDAELLNSTLGPLDYEDNLVGVQWIGGDICYYVEATESAVNDLGLQERSLSNQVCLAFPPRVFIPNAFTPDADGRNDRFVPDVNYVDPSAYDLRIYDRMGRLVYTATDPSVGWDGSGLPAGVYAYVLVLQNARSESLEYAGQVHLIR